MASASATVPLARANCGVPAPTESSGRTSSVPDLGSAIGSAVDQAPRRLVNTTACLPIVYGSVAFFLGKKADEYHTHRWTLFLRGPNNEDLSVCIAKVIFQLHPSFAQPVRELTMPPFEVTEQGWGEFEAQIRIVWKDPTEKSTMVNHGIKLYPPGATNATQPTMEPVVAETYDEVVFTDPNEPFYQQLMRISIVPRIQSNFPEIQSVLSKFTDNDEFLKLVEAQRFLENSLAAVKERMKLATDEMEQVDAALRKVQEAKNTASEFQRKHKATLAAGNAAKRVKPNP